MIRWGIVIWLVCLGVQTILLIYARQATTQTQYVILVASEDGVSYQIYRLALSNGSIYRLNTPPLGRQTVGLSPWGDQVLYVHESSGGITALYRTKVFGHDGEMLTMAQHLAQPTYSPNGQWIAFQADSHENTSSRLYLLDPKGLTTSPLSPTKGYYPTWSPDSQSLAFAVHVSGDSFQLYQMQVAEEDYTALGFAFHSSLRWSPDQTALAFNVRVSYSGDFEIYHLALSSGEVRRVTDGRGVNVNPTWSPDSQWIAFSSSRSGRMQIYRLRLADHYVEQLTTLEGDNGYPVWLDGQILFIQQSNTGAQVFVMRSDGSDVRPISPEYKHIAQAVWMPNQKNGWYPREHELTQNRLNLGYK